MCWSKGSWKLSSTVVFTMSLFIFLTSDKVTEPLEDICSISRVLLFNFWLVHVSLSLHSASQRLAPRNEQTPAEPSRRSHKLMHPLERLQPMMQCSSAKNSRDKSWCGADRAVVVQKTTKSHIHTLYIKAESKQDRKRTS